MLSVVVHGVGDRAGTGIDPAGHLDGIPAPIDDGADAERVQHRRVVLHLVDDEHGHLRIELAFQGAQACIEPRIETELDMPPDGLIERLLKVLRGEPEGQRIVGIVLDGRHQLGVPRLEVGRHAVRVGPFVDHPPEIVRVPFPVFRDRHQPVVQRPVFRGPRVWVPGLPVLVQPIDAPGVVEVVGDVLEEAGLRIVVQVEVVLVAGVAVPIAADDIEGLDLEEIGHVELPLQGARQVGIRGVVEDINEGGDVGVIVFLVVGLELVGAAPIDLKLVVVRLLADVLEGGRPEAFVEVAVVLVVVLLDELLVEVLGVQVSPHVLAVEFQPHVAGPRSGQAHPAQDVPTQARPEQGGIVLVGVHIELLEVGILLPRDEGIEVNLEALLRGEQRGVAPEPHGDGVNQGVHAGGDELHRGRKGIRCGVLDLAEQHLRRAVGVHGDGDGGHLLLNVGGAEGRNVRLGRQGAGQQDETQTGPTAKGANGNQVVHGAKILGFAPPWSPHRRMSFIPPTGVALPILGEWDSSTGLRSSCSRSSQ